MGTVDTIGTVGTISILWVLYLSTHITYRTQSRQYPLELCDTIDTTRYRDTKWVLNYSKL